MSPEVEIFNIQRECIIVQSIQTPILLMLISITLNAKNKYILGQYCIELLHTSLIHFNSLLL